MVTAPTTCTHLFIPFKGTNELANGSLIRSQFGLFIVVVFAYIKTSRTDLAFLGMLTAPRDFRPHLRTRYYQLKIVHVAVGIFLAKIGAI